MDRVIVIRKIFVIILFLYGVFYLISKTQKYKDERKKIKLTNEVKSLIESPGTDQSLGT